MKTIVDAFNYAMNELINLQSEGIKVIIQVPNSVKEGNWTPEKVKQYSLDRDKEMLPLEMWRCITIKPNSKEEAARVFEFKTDLYKRGISFDSGVGGCGIDLEFDWSFRYVKGELDFDRIEVDKDILQMAYESGLLNFDSGVCSTL